MENCNIALRFQDSKTNGKKKYLGMRFSENDGTS